VNQLKAFELVEYLVCLGMEFWQILSSQIVPESPSGGNCLQCPCEEGLE
jgi:hypothetical protein